MGAWSEWSELFADPLGWLRRTLTRWGIPGWIILALVILYGLADFLDNTQTIAGWARAALNYLPSGLTPMVNWAGAFVIGFIAPIPTWLAVAIGMSVGFALLAYANHRSLRRIAVNHGRTIAPGASWSTNDLYRTVPAHQAPALEAASVLLAQMQEWWRGRRNNEPILLKGQSRDRAFETASRAYDSATVAEYERLFASRLEQIAELMRGHGFPNPELERLLLQDVRSPVGVLARLERLRTALEGHQLEQPSADGNSSTPAPSRIFLTQTPSDLAGLYKTHSSLQVDRLKPDFVGRLMSVQGKVSDVRRNAGGVRVEIRHLRNARGPAPHAWVHADFPASRADHVSHLQRDDSVSVAGCVRDFADSWVILSDCELRAVDQAPETEQPVTKTTDVVAQQPATAAATKRQAAAQLAREIRTWADAQDDLPVMMGAATEIGFDFDAKFGRAIERLAYVSPMLSVHVQTIGIMNMTTERARQIANELDAFAHGLTT